MTVSLANMALPFKPSFPWLLYAYPWMPYPRRVIIYLREKSISQSLVKVVQVSDPPGNQVLDTSFPPRPPGSLPILAIPSKDNDTKPWIYIRQSMTIIDLIEELCNTNQYGFSSPHGSLVGKDLLSRARMSEVSILAEELTVGWNPVRMFGTNAGTMSYPQGAKEMLRWERRALMAIETWWREESRDMSLLRKGIDGYVTLADIVLYQFLEFTKDCYGVDMTVGSGETVKDVYGREVEERYPKLMAFYEAFSSRDSSKRDTAAGEVASEKTLKNMQTWVDGVL